MNLTVVSYRHASGWVHHCHLLSLLTLQLPYIIYICIQTSLETHNLHGQSCFLCCLGLHLRTWFIAHSIPLKAGNGFTHLLPMQHKQPHQRTRWWISWRKIWVSHFNPNKCQDLLCRANCQSSTDVPSSSIYSSPYYCWSTSTRTLCYLSIAGNSTTAYGGSAYGPSHHKWWMHQDK